jgi:hypothetical protein
MIDFEDRLRSGLSGLAGAVPPSRDAQDELIRRLAAPRRTRRHGPALAAAAAAVVLAGVAIPVLVQRGDEHRLPSGPAVIANDTDSATATATDTATDTGETGPITTSVTRVSDAYRVKVESTGRHWLLWVFTETTDKAEVCVIAAAPDDGQRATEPPVILDAEKCRATPVQPPNGGPPAKVQTMAVNDGNPPGGLLLFLAETEVATMEAGAADGSPVPVRQVVRTDGFVLFAADFGESSAGFRYTAKDAAGNVVESGIT